ncbi:hypothetical protein RvY_18431 [Ramazzottius varieornatus]|uniref:Uncharacterized protein n=1 Tax=Ramazzottius varieornatus TaxID=947166 RepID=A0A1D1W907_RAMVA|nr:hypothetical protein RvY_18431 [Ramazzottius varieornatus]
MFSVRYRRKRLQDDSGTNDPGGPSSPESLQQVRGGEACHPANWLFHRPGRQASSSRRDCSQGHPVYLLMASIKPLLVLPRLCRCLKMVENSSRTAARHGTVPYDGIYWNAILCTSFQFLLRFISCA